MRKQNIQAGREREAFQAGRQFTIGENGGARLVSAKRGKARGFWTAVLCLFSMLAIPAIAAEAQEVTLAGRWITTGASTESIHEILFEVDGEGGVVAGVVEAQRGTFSLLRIQHHGADCVSFDLAEPGRPGVYRSFIASVVLTNDGPELRLVGAGESIPTGATGPERGGGRGLAPPSPHRTANPGGISYFARQLED